ncbi:MAG TPA: efflux RND transporter periplasmic adaptor subunit [Verrucomicrobiae bacterium]|nr:efflux RND transporter periplasmic adaptor subunit [Verrucomicrobiae bacterium]
MSTETTPQVTEPAPAAPPPRATPETVAVGYSAVDAPLVSKRNFNWRLAAVLVLAVIAFPVWRAITGHANVKPLTAATVARRPVAVARATRQDMYKEVTVYAEFKPYLQVELHAKVSGYVENISVDIGDPVKSGQLLATLEVPELKDELDRAMAAEKRAQADYRDAHLLFTRLEDTDKAVPNSVAQQELDAAEAKDATAEAAVAAAKAEVGKYQTMLAYTHITAPFDGVVTHRYADPGSLIQAGTSSDTQSLPLVRLSDNYRLRLDFPVSVKYVKYIRRGDPVDVRVESLGGKPFTGTISRFAQKVDDETRTMITEIEVPNPNLELVPGMYATLSLRVERRTKALAIPTEATSPGKNPTVYLVGADGEIEERPVTLGLETPSNYEVVSGLKEGDLVMIGSRSEVKPGQKVEPKLLGSLARQ